MQTERDTEQIVFIGDFLDRTPVGVTVERPEQPQGYDITGRLGSIVTLAGRGKFVIVRQLPGQQWLANKLT